MSCYTWYLGETSENTAPLHKNHSMAVSRLQQRRVFLRLVLLSLVASLLLSFSFILHASAGGNEVPLTPSPDHAIIDVAPGQSLWTIAREHADGKSIKRYIQDIKELNDLEGNTLQVGQILYLP